MRPRTESRGRWPQKHRGVALLLVLGVLASLAWLCAALVVESRRQIAEQVSFTRRGSMRAAAWSATEAVVAVLRERALVDGAVYTVPRDPLPAMRRGGYEPPAGLEVAVDAEDLSGRYGLRGIGEDTLRDLLMDLGIPFEDAGTLADGMLAVAHPARRAERPGTPDDLPFAPERPAEDFADFAGVPGFAKAFRNPDGTPNARFAELQSCLALTGDTAQPNLNSASLPFLRHAVRRGLLVDAAALDRWLAGGDGRRGTDDDRFAKVSADLALSGAGVLEKSAVVSASRIRIHTTVRRVEGTFRLTVDLDPQTSGRAFPWKILAQREGESPR